MSQLYLYRELVLEMLLRHSRGTRVDLVRNTITEKRSSVVLYSLYPRQATFARALTPHLRVVRAHSCMGPPRGHADDTPVQHLGHIHFGEPTAARAAQLRKTDLLSLQGYSGGGLATCLPVAPVLMPRARVVSHGFRGVYTMHKVVCSVNVRGLWVIVGSLSVPLLSFTWVMFVWETMPMVIEY